MSQQGTDSVAGLKPMREIKLPEQSLDRHMYSPMQMATRRAPMPPPMNYVGVKTYKKPANDEDRTYRPEGVFGRYAWTGPVPAGWTVPTLKQI